MPNVAPGARAGMRRPVEVILRVSVNERGRVSNATYVSPGPGNYFARIARVAATSWVFTPPTLNGVPRPSAWTVLFYFERQEIKATATEDTK
jgi:TonB family protein